MTVNIALFEDLDAVAKDAAGALDHARRPSLYDRLDWFRLIHAHAPPPGRLAVWRARDGDRAAWLFLAVRGREASAYATWYSLRFNRIGDDDVMAPLAGAIRDSGIAELVLAPIAEPGPLADALREAGWRTRLTEKTGNWHARTEGRDFPAWWASRPGPLRSTARRKARAANLDIAILDRFDDAAWADYEAVYRASWKPEEGSFPFLRALASQEGAAGTLRLGLAYREGRPVAAQLWLVENGEATIHKLAYAEDAKALSPGTILGEAMFRRAIDVDRVRTIDYGTGDEPYKRDWMDARRPLWQLSAYNPTTVRGLAGMAKAGASRLVARLRSV